MIPIQSGKLDQRIIRLLARRSRLTAGEIGVLASAGRKAKAAYSQAAVYKELAKLRDLGVAVKDGAGYSLSLSWILEVMALSDDLAETYFTPAYLGAMLPAPGSRISWRFSRLLQANDLWNQALLALLKESGASEIYSWVPHPWFVLLHTAKEAQLNRALSKTGRRLYTIFGADGYLDRLAEKLHDRKLHRVAYAAGPFADKSDEYIDVIGDYVLTVKLDRATASSIDELFARVRSAKDLHPAEAIGLLRRGCRVKVAVENHRKKAEAIKKKFSEYFGL